MEREINIILTVAGLSAKNGDKHPVVRTSAYLREAVIQLWDYIKNEYSCSSAAVMLLNGYNVDLILKNDEMFEMNNGDKITVIPYFSGG